MRSCLILSFLCLFPLVLFPFGSREGRSGRAVRTEPSAAGYPANAAHISLPAQGNFREYFGIATNIVEKGTPIRVSGVLTLYGSEPFARIGLENREDSRVYFFHPDFERALRQCQAHNLQIQALVQENGELVPVSWVLR